MRRSDALAAAARTLSGSILGSASLLGFNIVAATVLTQDDFGALVAALAYVNLGLTIAAFGLAGFCAKAAAEEPDRFAVSGQAILIYGILASLSSAAIIVLIALTSSVDPVRSLTLTMIPIVIGYTASELIAATAQVNRHFGVVGFWLACPGVLRFLFLVVVCKVFGQSIGADAVAITVAVASVMVAVFAVKPLSMMVSTFKLLSRHQKVSPISIGGIARRASPFGFANGLYLVYSQAPILALAHSANLETVGAFGVAMMAITSAYLLPSMIVQRVFLVDIIAVANRDAATAGKLLLRVAIWSMALGAVAAVMLFFAAHMVAPYAFAEKYQETPGLLSVLLVALPVKFAEAVVGGFLMAKSGMTYKNLSVALTLLAQYPLLLNFESRFGGIGVAVVYVLTEAILLSLYFFWVRRKVFNNAR